jgi:type II secretory ATPase GspE/PulE/Tfp pilus assembly ATPase PilB-like protein
VQTKVVIKFLNGAEKSGVLDRAIHPKSNHVELHQNQEALAEICHFEDIASIKFPGRPDLAEDLADEKQPYEEITTLAGDRFHLRLKTDPHFAGGFYGTPIDPDSDFKLVFITKNGLRHRQPYRPLGEILQHQGGVTPAAIAAALAEQQVLREKRVGEILIEQHNLSRNAVEESILNAQKKSRKMERGRIGEILIDAGLVNRAQVEAALSLQSVSKRKRIGSILVDQGLISEDQLITALARKFGLEVVDLSSVTPSAAALKYLPHEMLVKMHVLPLEVRNNQLVVATANPTDPDIAQNLRFATNQPIELVVASYKQIAEQLARLTATPETGIEEMLDGFDSTLDVQIEEEQELDKVTESDSKVINLVNKTLLDAHKRGVSDIHFEPGMGSLPLRIRYRRDGICTQVHQVAATYKAAIISRLKIIAKLDITERRRPQSGKILLKHGRERIEYRVEITPTIGGQEDAVLRVLSAAQIYPLDQIGFSARNLERMRAVLKKPYGLILCVGPTGSGKTTTLHSSLAEINTPDRKIWTAEDPVEIAQEGLRQVQVLPKIGFTFEEALRSFLRADPDVIMIGEMRDPLTAKTALGASLTGHLVFSTLHTNNAAETVVRLIEMGLDPFNFADALLAIVAQRLTRRLCTHCREAYHPARNEYDDLVAAYGHQQFELDGLPPYAESLTLMRAKGCTRCDWQGYSGRIAIHEQLVNSPQIKEAIKHNAGVEKIRDVAIAEGMSTLRMDGIQKIFLGFTDFAQVNRVVV